MPSAHRVHLNNKKKQISKFCSSQSMGKKYLDEYKYSALIGRSISMPAISAADYWNRMMEMPKFSCHRAVPEVTASNMERQTWRLNKLFAISAYRCETDDEMELILPGVGNIFETELTLLPDYPWVNVCQLSGGICDIKDSNSNFITITSRRRRGDVDGFYSLGIYNSKEAKNAQGIAKFLQNILEVFGMSECIVFDVSVFPPRYAISKRQVGEFSLAALKRGDIDAESGEAECYIEISMPGKIQLKEALFRIIKCFPDAEIRWNKSRIGVKENHWNLAKSYLEKIHDGPWQQTHYRVPYKDWTSEMFIREGEKYDVIPVGVFDFPSSKKAGDNPCLRGRRILIDLFKEDSNWHFAFHCSRDILLKKQRELMRQSLNEHMGVELISLSLEMIWNI